MKTCLIIIPYFGKLPNYFNLFLNSCRYNDKFNFLLITNDDIGKFDIPDNFIVLNKEFSFIQRLIEEKISKDVVIDKPFKLCDYRPCYGYIFDEYLKGYKYWGHCDVDLIFGNLNKLVYPILEKEDFDKIFNLGHLTIYKNKESIKNLFFEELHNNSKNSVFLTSKNMKFDEENHDNSINLYVQKNNFKSYNTQLEADIYTKGFNLLTDVYNFYDNSHCIDKRKKYFLYSNGNLFSYMIIKNKLIKNEYSYIHLQKRPMKINSDIDINNFFIFANVFYKGIPHKHITIDLLKKQKTYYVNLHYFKLRYNNLIVKLKNRGIL